MTSEAHKTAKINTKLHQREMKQPKRTQNDFRDAQ